ncbi:MAG: sulfite exporter TauE/SafE family protein [Rhodospirillales bacterium]
MTPLLLAFGVHATTAVGTDLLYAAVTKTFGTAMHNAGNTVDWKIVRRLALGSVPATALTIYGLSYIGAQSKEVTATIKFVLGVALLLTAISIFLRKPLADFVARRFGEPSDRQAARMTVVSGIVLGILVSLSSVGAGAVGVTVLILLYPRIPLVRIVGSDIAHAVPLTVVAGFGHWLLGDVNFALMGSLLIGSIPGILAGSWLARRVPEAGLRPALATVLLVVGANLVKLF